MAPWHHLSGLHRRWRAPAAVLWGGAYQGDSRPTPGQVPVRTPGRHRCEGQGQDGDVVPGARAVGLSLRSASTEDDPTPIPCHTAGPLERVHGVRNMDGRPGVTVGAFDAFYARMRRPLAALAYAASGSALAADDLAQDALEAAYRDWERIRRLENPAAWVRRI